MQNLITINKSCNGPHIIEINNLTTYQAAIKKLSTYINLMWLIQDDDGKINASKIVGLCHNFIINPVIVDENLREIDYIGGRRRDIELYKEIVGIKRKLDDFDPVFSCNKNECENGARNIFYTKKSGEIWEFGGYLCYDHIKPYVDDTGAFTAPLKMSEIRKNETIPGSMGLREDVFRKILESAGYKGQEKTPAFSRDFAVNLEKRELQQMSLFI